ncbi:hypothetical protein ACFVH6_09860 [Spirillospora sp. NPDC127200]
MDPDELPEPLLERLTRPDPPVLEQVRRFLGLCFADALDLAEVRADLARWAEIDPKALHRYAVAIETLLADPPSPATMALTNLVALNVPWDVLDELSDQAADAWC